MADSFDLGEPPQPAKADAYRVLARKYRPQTFAALIGQDAMVTTLGNAIRRGRLAHAFLLTGVRGVGKTSTARLIAKALNCIGPDGQGGATIDPCGVCEPCVAIAEGRHMDVIEMDAASHTGVDDVREIIDASRYAAVSARYKIYIVDEVHMLSKNAFNALLKTLEEPPAHVKFLFATTEVNKVPVTVLSRCQRFDLRRIPAELLAEHFRSVTVQEGVTAEPEALAMIARAAEGSARDGLSILDQAIAHADLEGGGVTAPAVREMLGLSDRGAIRDMFALLLMGDAPGVLSALRRQYDHGVDPLSVARALLETVHRVTLAKVGVAADMAQPAEERAAVTDWAAQLSFPLIHRLWQLFLRGHEEIARAVLPIEAAEMALLRAIHASSLPDPGELARMVSEGRAPNIAQASASASGAAPAGAMVGASGAGASEAGAGVFGSGASGVGASEGAARQAGGGATGTGAGAFGAGTTGAGATGAGATGAGITGAGTTGAGTTGAGMTGAGAAGAGAFGAGTAWAAAGPSSLTGPSSVAAVAEPAANVMPATFAALVMALDDAGNHALAAKLHYGARLARYAPPEVDFSGARPLSAETLSELTAAARALTGNPWRVAMVDAAGEPTLKEKADAADAAQKAAILDTPVVRAALAAFPDAELTDWPKRSVS